MRDADTDGTASDGVITGPVGTEGSEIRGSATYKGPAVGKYAVASATDDSYEGGHFTAKATLMVDFDRNLPNVDTPLDADATRGVALSGMIDNFMTGDTARPDWMVNLMVDNDRTDGNLVLPTATLVPAVPEAGAVVPSRMLTTWSTGAAAEGTGTWTAQWYGGVTLDADGDNIVATGAPDAVVGTFNANIGNAARLQGAFGAMQDE